MIPRHHDADALAAIGESDCSVFNINREKVEFSTLLRLYSIIHEDGDSPVHAALAEVICRLVEIGIIRDPKIQALGNRWAALSVQAPSIVKNRIQELTGTVPPDKTVAHIVNILGGSAAQHGRRVIPYEQYLPDLFARQALRHPRKELRCTVCGYHFTATDLNDQRKLHAENQQLVLAESAPIGRITDVWKPQIVQVAAGGGKTRPKPVTGLTIDHMVPEEGLGWAGSENLELLCEFCNVGKLAYRWALEPVSQFGAGGLSDYPPGRALNKMAQTTVVSALRYSGGHCQQCSAHRDDVELTVRPFPEYGEGAVRGLAPWNLNVLCYDCVMSSE